MFGLNENKTGKAILNQELVMKDLEYLLNIHRKELDGQVDYVEKETHHQNFEVTTKPPFLDLVDTHVKISRPGTSWSGYNIRENVRNYFHGKKEPPNNEVCTEVNGVAKKEEDDIGQGNGKEENVDKHIITEGGNGLTSNEVETLEISQEKNTDIVIEDKATSNEGRNTSKGSINLGDKATDGLPQTTVSSNNERITLTAPYSVYQVPCTRIAIPTALQSYEFMYKLQRLRPSGGQLYSRWKLWEEECTTDELSPCTDNSIRTHKVTTTITTQTQLLSMLARIKSNMRARRVCENIAICRDGVFPNRNAVGMKSGGTLSFQVPFEFALEFLGQTASMVLTETINPPHDIQVVPICGIQHKAKLRYSLIIIWLQDLPQDVAFVHRLPEVIHSKLAMDLKQYALNSMFSLNANLSEDS